MSAKLYFHPMSTNARRATLAAKHIGAAVELVLVDLAKGEQRAPEYVLKNPNAKVPLLDDDGFMLNECYAIMAYLCDKHGASTLYPTALKARADVNRWLFWCANEFSPQAARLNFENYLKAMFYQGTADPLRVAEHETNMKRLAGLLDRHLSGRQWLCGDELTLADFAVGATLMTTVPGKLPVLDFRNVQAWFGRIQQLDAWKTTAV